MKMRGVIPLEGTNSVLFVLETVWLVVETDSSAGSGCLRISPLTIFPLGAFLVLVDFFFFVLVKSLVKSAEVFSSSYPVS